MCVVSLRNKQSHGAKLVSHQKLNKVANHSASDAFSLSPCRQCKDAGIDAPARTARKAARRALTLALDKARERLHLGQRPHAVAHLQRHLVRARSQPCLRIGAARAANGSHAALPEERHDLFDEGIAAIEHGGALQHPASAAAVGRARLRLEEGGEAEEERAHSGLTIKIGQEFTQRSARLRERQRPAALDLDAHGFLELA